MKENKIFGCRDLFGCRVACPLWRAREVEFLCNEKGMTLGEAHRATVRTHLTEPEVKNALQAIFKSGKETISINELLTILYRYKGEDVKE